MRALVFILPFFVSLYYLLRDRRDLAFLNVYLPCLLLLPDYYAFRVPHLPPQSAASWAILPLGLSLLFYPLPHLQLRRMDLWITLFALSLAATEVLREPNAKDGLASFLSDGTSWFLAYIVGRRIIEPGLRVATVQRIVLLFVCMTPLVFYEYAMTRNPWMMMASHFHLDISAGNSIRDGRLRVQASFGHAILAGILFFVAFMLNELLLHFYKDGKGRLQPIVRLLERYRLPALLMAGCLWLTQSRGPMLSIAVGYAILQIPRFRHPKIAAFVLLLLFAIVGDIGYNYFERYTDATYNGTLSEEQTSAMYRRDLLKNYGVLAEQGGWLGWGESNIPHVPGQQSIDNGFLLIKLGQGKLGLYFFLAILVEGLGTTAFRAFTFKSREVRLSCFTLLGALIGIALSLTLVFFGPVVAPVYFLLLGWSQSIEDEQVRVPRFRFQRLFA